MLNVPYEIKQLIKSDTIRKNFRVVFVDGSMQDLTNKNIVAESVQFTESFCSQSDLKFGLCESSYLSFEVFNVPNIKGKKIKAYLEVECDESIGEYKADIDMVVYQIPYGVFIIDTCRKDMNDLARRKVTSYSVDKSVFAEFKDTLLYKQLTKGSWYKQTSFHAPLRAVMESIQPSLVQGEVIEMPSSTSTLLGRYYIPIEIPNVFYGHVTINMWGKRYSSVATPTINGEGISTTLFNIDGVNEYNQSVIDTIENSRSEIADLTRSYLAKYSQYETEIQKIIETIIGTIKKNVSVFCSSKFAKSSVLRDDNLSYSYNGTSYETSVDSLGYEVEKKIVEDGSYQIPSYGMLDGNYELYGFSNINIPYQFSVTFPVGGISKRFAIDVPSTFSASVLPSVYYRPLTSSQWEHNGEVMDGLDSHELSFLRDVKITETARKYDAASGEYISDVKRAGYIPNAKKESDIYSREWLESYLELQVLFGKSGRDGNFTTQDLNLSVALYPSDYLHPSDGTYPKEVRSELITRRDSIRAYYDDEMTLPFGWITTKYKTIDDSGEEVEVELKYDFYQFEDNDGNEIIDRNEFRGYDITNNELLQNLTLTEEQMIEILETIANRIKDIRYVPAEVDLVGLPYVEAGDFIEVLTKDSGFMSLILRRNLSGIHALQDNFDSL